jgi:hypothetical protein
MRVLAYMYRGTQRVGATETGGDSWGHQHEVMIGTRARTHIHCERCQSGALVVQDAIRKGNLARPVV